MSQSLGFFVKKAREQNPELQAVQVDYSAALEKVPQVEQLVNPTLGIGAVSYTHLTLPTICSV